MVKIVYRGHKIEGRRQARRCSQEGEGHGIALCGLLWQKVCAAQKLANVTAGAPANGNGTFRLFKAGP